MKTRFMNFSLTKKILIIYCISVLLPTSILMGVIFRMNISSMQKSYLESQKNVILSAKETQMLQFNELTSKAEPFRQSNVLLNMLSGNYPKTSDYIFYYLQDVQPLLKSAKATSQIRAIHIYGFSEYPFDLSEGITFVKNTNLTQEFIQELQKTSTLWQFSIENGDPKLSYFSAIYGNDFPYYYGILHMELDPSICLENFIPLSDHPIYCQLLNNKNSIFQWNGKDFISLSSKDSSQIINSNFTEKISFRNSNFSLLLPLNSMPTTSSWIYFILLLLATLLIFTVFYCLVTFSILKRLHLFSLHIQNSEAEKLTLYEDDPYQDEVGQVISAYNQLLTRTNYLIHENLLVQIQKKESDYYALQAQIHPHFLYNILENIRMSAELHHDSETGDMLQALGQHMRYTLNMTSRPITLDEELQFAKNFLRIHKLRMKDKLDFQILISAETDAIICPRFLFQPLLENSLVHGYRLDRPLTIQITITEGTKSRVIVTITDNGNGIDNNSLTQLQTRLKNGEIEVENHVGILNVNRRLMSFSNIPQNYLHIKSTENTGTEITFFLERSSNYEDTDC